MLKIIFALVATVLLALLMSYLKFRYAKKEDCPLWLLCVVAGLWILAFFFSFLIVLYAAGVAILHPILKIFGLVFV